METTNLNNNSNLPKKSNTWMYLTAIIAVLVGLNLYLYYSKNKDNSEKELLIEENVVQDSTIRVLQTEYNASLVRLDELVGKNAKLDSLLTEKDGEISKIKKRISEITSKSKISEQEYKEAKSLIESLKIKLSNYEAQIDQLKKENAYLKGTNDSLLTNNAVLQDKIELGKVLHASNMRLTPIDLRKGGRKEKETAKAKRVDVLRIAFDIDRNLVDEDGDKILYICVINPEGELLTNPALGSGSFTNADGKLSYYSLSKKVYIEKGKSLNDITLDWNQGADYIKGDYKVIVYHKGYEIGQEQVSLR